MLTRREFIGAGLGAAAATHAFALPGDKMRYAMSGHQFRGLKPHPETGIKIAAQYGYHGLEPFEDDMPRTLFMNHAARQVESAEDGTRKSGYQSRPMATAANSVNNKNHCEARSAICARRGFSDWARSSSRTMADKRVAWPSAWTSTLSVLSMFKVPPVT